jgi:adenylate cyclase
VQRRRWRRRRRLLLAATAALAGALGIVIHATGLLHRSELSTIDARYRIRGSDPQLVKDFVIVGVDDRTFTSFFYYARSHPGFDALWPFPRRDHARVIDDLIRAGAREIAFDITFATPTDSADDDALYEAVGRAGHMVLAATEIGPHGSTSVLGGNASLAAARARAGSANIVYDSDGVIRRMRFEQGGLDTFPVAVAQNAGGRGITARLFGGAARLVPIDFAGPPHTVPEIPYSSVYFDRFRPSQVRGKIVIVGDIATAQQDLHPTPTTTNGAKGTGSAMSGAEIQANMAATILAHLPLRDAPGWVNVLAILALAGLPALFGLRGWMLRLPLVAVAAAGLYAVAVQLAFDGGWIVAFVDPLAGLALGLLGTLAVITLSEAFERQYARTLFARFVPPGVVDEVLARADDDLRLGGVQRVATIMFSDLRGFTSYAETLPAERVIEVINYYLNEMTEAILAAGGTLIDYMGDGIMAAFGVPLEQEDHADRALRAAREMADVRLPRFNRWLRETGASEDFRMGIGLNSGPVMAGNVGARERVGYTAIGDTTNTAARLEGMTKGGMYTVFISAATRELLREGRDDLEFVGEFEVRGRLARIAIYSPAESAGPAGPAGPTESPTPEPNSQAGGSSSA